MYYIYLLKSNCEYYLGYSSDLKRRLSEHNAGQNKSTSGRQWELVYYEAYQCEKVARKREKLLKHDGRAKRAVMERVKAQE